MRRHRTGHRHIDAGYADQAHLARECRALTGLTPSNWVHTHRAWLGPKTTPPLTAPTGSELGVGEILATALGLNRSVHHP
jgi:hypothetical protein